MTSMEKERIESQRRQGSALRVAWVYDMDACRGPTGVTRHALAQLERLAARPDVDLKVISGRISASDGLIYWDSLGKLPRKELPISMRNALRVWRTIGGPPLEWWTGGIDWAYSPSDYFLATKAARRAVTCHDILQDLRFGGERRKALLAKTFGRADLVLSVSNFNTDRLREAFPHCRDKIAYVPNAADDLFYDPTPEADRARVRADLGLPQEMPYLLSVANFQPRKNLARLVRAAGKLDAVARGELALVMLGDGDEDHARPILEAITELGKKAVVKLPGYRQGASLRAVYSEATALVFPSTCESFGIPAVEAMAQGIPVALANTTALPEIAGEAGWYFDPENEESITASLWAMLDLDEERARRVQIGRERAEEYRWDQANSRLVEALQRHR
jgi:glycosyltransferase involved in cell wall biosynthesis